MAILIIALVLRVYNLNELTAGDDSQFGELVAIGISSPWDVFYNTHPPDESNQYDDSDARDPVKYTRPFVVIPLLVSTGILGFTPLALLAPTVITALVSIILLFLLMRDIYTTRTALFGAALLAISPFHILFSRNAFLHSQLTMLWLASALLFIKALRSKRVDLIYLAAGFALVSHFTTDLRGLVPLMGLIPLFFLAKPDRRVFKHTLIAAALSGVVMVLYPLVPYLLTGETGYLSWLGSAFLQGIGQDQTLYVAKSWSATLKANIGMPLFSPLLGMMVVPAMFGVFRIVKNLRKPINAFIITSLVSGMIFVVSRQIYFERLVIYVPIVSLIAAVGICDAESRSRRAADRNFILYLLMGTIIYTALLPIPLGIMFPQEFSPIQAQLSSLGIEFILHPIMILTLIAVIIAGTYVMTIMSKRYRTVDRLSRQLPVIILFTALLAVPSVFVFGGVGEYDRARGAYAIAKHLDEQSQGSELVCSADLFSRVVTYYNQRVCLNMNRQTDSVMDAAEAGRLKYIVIDSPRLHGGEFFGSETLEDKSPELYEWIGQNTEDVTAEVAGSIDRDSFRLLKVSTQPLLK